MQRKKSTPAFESALSCAVNTSYLPVELIAEVVNWPLHQTKKAARHEHANELMFTAFNQPSFSAQVNHLLELKMQLYRLYQTLNDNLDPHAVAPKGYTVQQLECIADLALNSPLSIRLVSDLMNMKEAYLHNICSAVGGITDSSRFLSHPDQQKILNAFKKVKNDRFQVRINAIKRRIKNANPAAM